MNPSSVPGNPHESASDRSSPAGLADLRGSVMVVRNEYSPATPKVANRMQPTQLLGEFPFAKARLSNGLDVIARRQGILPLVAVNLWYHVGSKDEERRQRGFAHLFEHLMFEGSEHFPGDFFKPLQRLGATVNGSTSPDRTNYFEDLPAAHVEVALEMEADRMGHLLPALDDRKLRVQKDVVKNEYRQNYANRPYGQVGRLLAEAIYPPDHPYSWLTIGAMEDVEAASRDDVEAFFRRHYVPANASLAIVGDIDPDRAFALAERHFGGLAGGASSLRPRTPRVALEEDIPIRLHDRVELDRDYLAWPGVPHFHADDAPLSLLADVLGQGRASRLYRKLVLEEELAQDVSAYQSPRELAGTFGVVATLRPGRSWERARALVDAEVRAVADRGVTSEEFSRAINARVAGFVYALDNVGGFGGVADRLNAYNTYLGDPGRITTDLERYRTATPDDLRRVARQYVADRPRVALTVLGRKKPEVIAPATVAAEAAAAPVVFRAPKPEPLTLGCGAPLWVIPRRDLPIVAATLVVAAGASSHGPDRGGLAHLTASMLDEGTTGRTGVEIAEAAEGMGTSLSTSCGWDGSYIGFQCLTPHLDASLDLAADLLLRPAFREPDWDRLHAQTLAALKAERDHAESRAHRALLRALYGAGSPYRVPVSGEASTVASLNRSEAARFHARLYRPDQAAWVVAGDVDPDRIAEALDRHLADWSGPAAWEDPTAGRKVEPGPRLILIDRPGAPQAVLRVGHVGIARNDPDFDAALVLNQVLGGQFTSRLNARLREEKGFTYGVRSQFDARRDAGPFVVSTSVQTDSVAEALGDLRDELIALTGDRPPTASELDDARRSLIEGQARQFETPAALVSRYASLFLYSLPLDHHTRFADRLGALTLDQLAEVARRQVRPAELVAVVVADASLVAGPLEGLGWGPVEVVKEMDLEL